MMKRTAGTTCMMIALAVLFISGCGNNNNNPPATTTSTPASTYLVEYIPGMMSATVGKTTFQIRVRKRSDSSAATGLTISLLPMMYMSGGMSHSTPVDVVTESGTTPGTYDCTIYYLMASGSGMGYWELQVKIGTETATFYPSVSMAMIGSDTTSALLYGPDDIVSSMSGTQYRKYYLFSDGLISAGTPTFRLFIAHDEDMKMRFVPVSGGSVLSAPTGTVTSMVVSASTNSTFPGGATVTGSDSGNGHWSMTGLSDLSSAGTYTVYVKLQVNGQDKTTNGSLASGTNAYQVFKVTSH